MSKYIFITIVVLLVLGGIFYLYQNNNALTSKSEETLANLEEEPTTIPMEFSTPTAGPTIQPEPTKSAGTLPMQVVASYYQTFTDCLKNPPAAATGHVSVYCQEHNEYAGIDLPGNLDKVAKKGYVPVICAQTPPESAEPISAPEVTETNATVLFKENFGSASSIEITYLLSPEGEGNTWKVQNIICPTP